MYATGCPDPETDLYAPGSLTHHRFPTHLLTGAFKGHSAETGTGTLQNPFRDPFGDPFRNLLGFGGSAAGIRVQKISPKFLA